MNWFWKKPPINHFQIKDVLGNVIFVAPRPDLWMQDFHGVVWHNAMLHGVDLGGSNLENADLMGSKLNGARLCNANLRNANLSYCNLSDVDFSGSDITGADFTNSEFGSWKYRSKFTNCKGLDKALISPYEPITAGTVHKPIRFTKTSFDKAVLKVPPRPRCLLVLGEPGYQHKKYEGGDRNKEPRPKKTRPTRWSRRHTSAAAANPADNVLAQIAENHAQKES